MSIRLFFLFFLFVNVAAFGAEVTFIAVDGKTDNIITQHGSGLHRRISPCSTFKIALGVMGYDAAILQDEETPEWPNQGYECFLESWRGPQTPKTWMSRSVVWYSQLITPQLGMDRIQKYLANFNFGNQDMKGDPGKDNGLTHAWLSSSLMISPWEQIAFLKMLAHAKLPVSQEAQHKTQNILFVEDLDGGWQLFGKSGTGSHTSDDGSQIPHRKIGWYVGWIKKQEDSVIFALAITDAETIPSPVERRELAKQFLQDAGLFLHD